jgi:replicative superfamily II helicase
MNEYIFETCSKINDLLTNSKEREAREELIKLLDYHETNQIEYTSIVNHLIRETGLYPYIHPDTASWEDKFVCEAFKVDTGEKEEKTLYSEQSLLLKKLIEGKNIAVSAPTSFGKSFVIDAFISLKNPRNVVIIVPTIALTDETRRRLYKKFANKYKIITTPKVDLGEKNIFIFPQERAVSYIEKINNIDILIIDEFYKAGIAFDKERAPILLKAILELGKKAKQKYFLAPNISDIEENPITEGMEFIPLDFNTVFSEVYEIYKESGYAKTYDFKAAKMAEILHDKSTKTLIYAGTFDNIDTITNILKDNLQEKQNKTFDSFSDWLKINYSQQYILADIVRKGVGIHNGRLHRSLSQIQVKLFEEEKD